MRTHGTDKSIERRFSEGIEQLPETPEKSATRRFSEGIEQLPETPEDEPAPARASTQRAEAAL